MQYVHSTHLIVIGIVQYIIPKVINESSIKINFWQVIITMNELPVIGYPCLRKELWNCQGGKHCKSLEGNVWREVVLTPQNMVLGSNQRFLPLFYRKSILEMLIRGKCKLPFE